MPQISCKFPFGATNFYFLKAKKTASTIKMNETMWFQRNVSVLKTVMTMVVNTVSETASCMTFS